MNILHIVPSISPAMGGPTEVVIHLVRALRAIGVDSEIATTNDDVGGELDVPLESLTEYRGVPCRFFQRSSLRKRQYIFSWPMTRWLWNNISRYDMVDIHYLFTYSSSCAAWICRCQGVPYTMRTIGQLAPWSLEQSALRKKLYTLFIERKNLCSASAIHCTSAGEAEDVERFGVTAPRVTIPLGVERLAAPPDARARLRRDLGVSDDTLLLLFLSRLHPKKRAEVLLEALRRMIDCGSRAEVVIAGDGEPEYESSLKQLVTTLGIESKVHFLGFVQNEDKSIALAGADIFVLPSHSENFGIAVAEALAAGLPVVITPEIQIAPDVAASGAGIVTEGNADSFAAALLELESSPARRRELGRNGAGLAERVYDWNTAAARCAEVYRGVIDRAERRQPLRKHAISTL